MSNDKKIDNLFLSIGMMKTATTWLYSVLDKHPDIYFSHEKEIHYFGHFFTPVIQLNREMRFKRMLDSIMHDDQKQYNPQDLKMKLIWYSDYISEPINDNWYINLFKNKTNEKYCADFSNLTCHVNKEGWRRIKNIARNLKVIIILRHPVHRLFSHVNYHVTIFHEHQKLSNWSKSEYRKFCKKPFIWRNVFYADIIKRLITTLHEKQYRIYFYEEIINNKKKFIENIEEFLGIKKFKYPKNILDNKVNVTKKVSMPNFFYDLFIDEFINDVKNLRRLGIQPPEEWEDLT